MSRPRVSARPLTEGALFAALTVVLSLIGFYVPVMGLFVAFLWPVPIAIIAVRHGMRTAILTVITAGVVLSTVVGIFEGAMMTLTLGLTGLAIGFALRRGYNATRTLLIATIGVVVGSAVTIVVSLLVMKINILTQSMEQFALAAQKTSEMYIAMADKLNIPRETIEPALQMFSPQALDLMKLILPGTFILGEFIVAYLNYEVCRRIMPRFGYKVPNFPTFEEWRFPKYFAVVLLLGQGVTVLKDADAVTVLGRAIQVAPHGEMLYKVGLNLSYPIMILMYLQGFALAYYFLVNKLRVDRKWAKMLLTFVWFNPMLSQIAFMFGLVDNVFDYRKMISLKPK